MSLRTQKLEKLFMLTILLSLFGPALGIKITVSLGIPTIIICFILAVMILLHWRRTKELELSALYPIRGYVYLIIFWMSYGFLSLLWAVSVRSGVNYLTFLGVMTSFSLLIPYFNQTEENFDRLKNLLFWVYAIVFAFGAIESVTLIHLPISRAFGTLTTSVTSIFVNQNDLATCITLILPFLLASFFVLKLNRKQKWIVYIAIMLAYYDLLATASRANTFLALPLFLIVLFIAIPRAVDWRKWTRKNVTRGIIMALVGIILVNVSSSLFLSAEGRQITQSKLASIVAFIFDVKNTTWSLDGSDTNVIEGESGQSATVRKYLILNGLRFLHNSHYLGVGPGNIEPMMVGAPKVNKVNMHNWWVEILVDFGVLTFVVFMTFYIWMLRRLWKLANRKISPQVSPLIRWGAISSFASLVGFFFGAMSPSSVIHFAPMWITYGVALTVIMLGENQKRKAQAEENVEMTI